MKKEEVEEEEGHTKPEQQQEDSWQSTLDLHQTNIDLKFTGTSHAKVKAKAGMMK